SVAGADSDPLRSPALPAIAPLKRPSPKSGYWYWALRADASVSPPAAYRQDTKGRSAPGPYYNVDRFGFLTYPDSPSVGRDVLIINEGNTLFKRRVEPSPRPGPGAPPGPVTHPSLVDFPSDAVAEREWKRLD
ncbi:MAG TPA: hypothetical protein VJB14_06420, partial [Planctomycetota bacterium]|nr:hypothetical protein [Planctomycetota bacterium]